MQIKGLKRLKTLTDRLNIITLKELEEFYKANARQGEDLVTTLERVLTAKN
jgi:hypothetical protein